MLHADDNFIQKDVVKVKHFLRLYSAVDPNELRVRTALQYNWPGRHPNVHAREDLTAAVLRAGRCVARRGYRDI